MSRTVTRASKSLHWVCLGGVLSYYTGVFEHIRELINSSETVDAQEVVWPWSRIHTLTVLPARLGGWASVSFAGLTVLLFLYLILLPKLSGRALEYTHWKNSEQLRVVIPILTATIFSGWTVLLFSLWRFSLLPFWTSVLASSGLYILSFGLLGLIPVFWT